MSPKDAPPPASEKCAKCIAGCGADVFDYYGNCVRCGEKNPLAAFAPAPAPAPSETRCACCRIPQIDGCMCECHDAPAPENALCARDENERLKSSIGMMEEQRAEIVQIASDVYRAVWRGGWEPGKTTNEAFDRLHAWLCDEGCDPNDEEKP